MKSSSDDAFNSKCIPDGNPGWKFWRRRRNIVAVMTFFGFFNVYTLRANLSIAIVAMTENKTVIVNNETKHIREFDWDSEVQGYILGSFFYGYITTQIIGGWLATKFGGQRLFGFGVVATSVLTLLTPFVANASFYWLIALRIIEGIFEGVTYPCCHALWSVWAPPLERASLVGFSYSGAYIGTVFAMPVCALLADYFGWPSIFYFSGVLGIIWYIVWLLLVAERPSHDLQISKEELRYLDSSLSNLHEKNMKRPWKEMLTSSVVWAIIVTHFCENWGFYTFLTQLPKFMKDILGFDLAGTGGVMALPYLCMSIMLIFSSKLSDWLQVKKVFSTTVIRKLFNCIAFVSQAVFIIGAAFSTTVGAALVCLISAATLGSFSVTGFSVNYLDIAPQHASILMGIGNTFGTLPGIVSPVLTGYIVRTPTSGEWQIVFFITAFIYLFGSIIYGCLATAELQSWAVESEIVKAKNEKSGNPT